MTVSEKSIAIKANTMRLVLSTVFTLGAVVGGGTAISSFNATHTPNKIFATKASEEIARIDETPDRHDASGGRVSVQNASPAAIA